MVSHLRGLIYRTEAPVTVFRVVPLIYEESLFKYDSHCIRCLSDCETEKVLKKIEEAEVGIQCHLL